MFGHHYGYFISLSLSLSLYPFQAMCGHIFLIAIMSMISGISGDCTPGTQLNKDGDACESCKTGYFKTAKSNDKCIQHTNCPAGKYTTASGSSTTQPKCETCATGFFKPDMDISGICKGPDSGRFNDFARHHVRVGIGSV